MVLGARIVDHKPGFEIVEGIENKIDVGNVVFDVCRIDVIDSRVDLYRRIDVAQFRFSCDCFGKVGCDVVFIEQRLTLQIRQLDKVAIDDPHKTNAGSYDLVGRNSAERSQTQNEDAGCSQPVLSGIANWSESSLTRISVIERQWIPSPA